MGMTKAMTAYGVSYLQSGNDFLPSIPSLEIHGRPSGLDVLLETYKEQLPALKGPITNAAVINMDRLKRMLTKLAEDEDNAFKRLSVSSSTTLFELLLVARLVSPCMW